MHDNGVMKNAKYFVLVHGGYHGAWCWYKVVTILKSAGYRVTALDLGGCGINPKKLEEITSISDYLKPLMDFMASLPQHEKVVLVGHSYAGLGISLAMEHSSQKISVAIFLAAYMPNCNCPPGYLIQEYFKENPMESLMDCCFTFADGPEKPPTSAIFGPEYMKSKLYKHCEPADLELAQLLVRPTRLFLEDLCNELLLSESKFGSVNRVFVVCEEDEVMKEEFQQSMIENSPPQELKLIKGAGHMIMLSHPKQLCLCLQEVADNYH